MIVPGDILIAAGQETEFSNWISARYPLWPQHFVLEAGCGTGKLGISLAVLFGCHVTLTDNDPKAIIVAQRLKACVNALKRADIPVCIAASDITHMDFNDDAFNLVFNEGVIEHFRDPMVPLNEMVRVSRDAVAVFVPNAKNATQVGLAKKQTEAFKDRPDYWPSYEQPMLETEVHQFLERAGLTDIHTGLLWADPRPPRTRDDFRMIFGFGRKIPAVLRENREAGTH